MKTGLKLNKDDVKEDLRTHMKTFEAANEQPFTAMKQELKDYVDSCGPKPAGANLTSSHQLPHQSFAAPSEPRFRPLDPEGRFVAKRIFLKVWCRFGREAAEGLKEQDAKNMCLKIMALWRAGSRSLLDLDRIQASYFRSRQVTIQIIAAALDNAAYLLTQEINSTINTNSIHVSSRPVYAVGDAAQWKNTRNAALAKASSTVENELMIDGGAAVAMTMDWSAGQLWGEFQHHAHLLGSWNRNKGWLWCASIVKIIWPKPDMAVLGTAVDMSCQTHNVHEICCVSWNVDRIATLMVDDFMRSCMNKRAILLVQERGAIQSDRFGQSFLLGSP